MVLLLYGVLAGFLALVVPYHAWDALCLGEWSRLIAETGAFQFPHIGAWYHHRPLYYVLQGWIWRLLGFDERLGRLVALAFAALLIAAVFRLGRMGAGPVRAALAVGLLVAIPHVALGAISGLTDVPVAALVAATAALSWSEEAGRFRPIAIALLAAAAGLTKPSAFPGLAGVALAPLVGPRDGLRSRLIRGSAPIVVGAAVALSYDVLQARHLGVSVQDFFTTGVQGYYADLSRQVRLSALLNLDWLGPDLHLPLLLALLYSLLRIVGLGHGPALMGAGPGAIIGSWLGPWVASGAATASVGPLTSVPQAVTSLLLVALFLLAGACPAEKVPPPRELARWLVWAAPPVAAWLVGAPYDTRLLSAAWAPLALLVASAALMALHGARRLHTSLAVAAVVALFLLPLGNLMNLDGGLWRYFSDFASVRFEQAAVRRMVLGPLAEAVDRIGPEMGPGDRLFSSDGRFGFFFPGRGSWKYPTRCEDLLGHRVFVLRMDPVTRTVQEKWVHASADPAFWAACRTPRLTVLRRVSELVIFRIEPPSTPATSKGS